MGGRIGRICSYNRVALSKKTLCVLSIEVSQLVVDGGGSLGLSQQVPGSRFQQVSQVLVASRIVDLKGPAGGKTVARDAHGTHTVSAYSSVI